MVAGSFTMLGGQTRSRIGRLTSGSAAFQQLAVEECATRATWTYGGSAPELEYATFEVSSDGVSYTPLGLGARAGSGWQLSGLSLPLGQTFYLRARGPAVSGYSNGSRSLIESVRQFHLVLPPATPPVMRIAPGGSPAHLHCRGVPGLTYTLLASTNLADWSDAATLTAGSDGWFEHPVTDSLPAQFFRLRRP